MRAVNRIGLVLGAAGLLASCGPPRLGYVELRQLGVGARFGLENLCSGSQSPPIRVVDAPRDVAAYRIRVSNVTVLVQTPREWTIQAPGDPELIPFGALADWSGPCPGNTQLPRYRIEALALDRAGTAIAYGWTEVTVEPVNKQAQDMWRRGRSGTVMDPTKPPAVTPAPDLPSRDPFARDPFGRDAFGRERDGGIFERDRGEPIGGPLPPGMLQR